VARPATGSVAATADPRLPRPQVGSQPQHLLLTLLGDYFCDRTEHIPSAALVRVLGEFGITSAGSRAALSRLSRRGLLISAKSGRHTYYGLTDRAADLLREGVRRILGFGAADRSWDGNWTVVAFSVPEDQRQARPVLRARLRWLGFAPLYDGFWITPHPPSDDIAELLDELNVGAATVLVGRLLDRAQADHPLSAWDLEELRAVYTGFVDRFAELLVRLRSGEVGASEGLVARTTVMDSWRNMPNLDPELPAELLPSDWPRQRARQVFVEIYDGLGALAEMRIRQILSEFSPKLARSATHHTTDRIV
jgi:phenylacetic acid degradation operon negative regulatory protein